MDEFDFFSRFTYSNVVDKLMRSHNSYVVKIADGFKEAQLSFLPLPNVVGYFFVNLKKKKKEKED